MEDIKHFINDWDVNKKDFLATHISGVGFKYIQNGEDGNPRLEILDMPKWFQKEMSKGKSLQECNKYLVQLRNQFIIIHKELMQAPFKYVSIPKGVNNER